MIIEALKWILALVFALVLGILGNPGTALVLIIVGIGCLIVPDDVKEQQPELARAGVLMLLGGLLCAGLIAWQIHKYNSDQTWCGQNYQPGQEFANCMEGLGHEPPTEAQ